MKEAIGKSTVSLMIGQYVLKEVEKVKEEKKREEKENLKLLRRLNR